MRTHELESRVGSLPVPEQGEDVEEELDDVDVQHHGPEDVVVHAEGVPAPADDQLRVEDQVEGEHQDPQAAVDLVHQREGEEHAEEAEDHQDQAGRKEVGSEAGEVRLCEEGVGSETADKDAGANNGQQHGGDAVVGAAHADEDALRSREAREEEVVRRELAQVPLAATGAHQREQEAEVQDRGHDHQGEAVAGDPVLHSCAEHKGRCDGSREQQLRRQDPVDLGDKAGADLWRLL
mmetsp:Transcript_26003/g.82584  ORF Transcript_26003/g.82584 Transcript_26003/m.82584 type:complete len:236 (+) Transcript_26003:1966-2673(+)